MCRILAKVIENDTSESDSAFKHSVVKSFSAEIHSCTNSEGAYKVLHNGHPTVCDYALWMKLDTLHLIMPSVDRGCHCIHSPNSAQHKASSQS